jgi:8-oxo-dGTP pyrophosphatase MutT (NUDIX family)
LLTRRAAHLRHHGGQISFPGGKVEGFDKNIVATALRETEEEIGISKNDIEVIGQLQQYQTISGFIISPVVGFIKNNHIQCDVDSDHDSYEQVLNSAIDKNEVDEVFLVPLTHFINVNNCHSVTVCLHNQSHQVHFMPYKKVNIWGATAAILKDLAAHLVH